jgi:hypothetical protein
VGAQQEDQQERLVRDPFAKAAHPQVPPRNAPGSPMTWIRNHALGLVIATAFWLAWIGQLFADAASFMDDQAEHHEHIATVWQVISQADFWEQFWSNTLQNWQSEFLQWGGVIWLSVWLIHKGSAESRDSEDRIEAKIDELLQRSERG